MPRVDVPAVEEDRCEVFALAAVLDLATLEPPLVVRAFAAGRRAAAVVRVDAATPVLRVLASVALVRVADVVRFVADVPEFRRLAAVVPVRVADVVRFDVAVPEFRRVAAVPVRLAEVARFVADVPELRRVAAVVRVAEVARFDVAVPELRRLAVVPVRVAEVARFGVAVLELRRLAVVPVRVAEAVRFGPAATTLRERVPVAPGRLGVVAARVGVPCSVARVVRSAPAPVVEAIARLAATGWVARLLVETRRAVAVAGTAVRAEAMSPVAACRTEVERAPLVAARVPVAERAPFVADVALFVAAEVRVDDLFAAVADLRAAVDVLPVAERPAPCFEAFLAAPSVRFVRRSIALSCFMHRLLVGPSMDGRVGAKPLAASGRHVRARSGGHAPHAAEQQTARNEACGTVEDICARHRRPETQQRPAVSPRESLRSRPRLP